MKMGLLQFRCNVVGVNKQMLGNQDIGYRDLTWHSIFCATFSRESRHSEQLQYGL